MHNRLLKWDEVLARAREALMAQRDRELWEEDEYRLAMLAYARAQDTENARGERGAHDAQPEEGTTA